MRTLFVAAVVAAVVWAATERACAMTLNDDAVLDCQGGRISDRVVVEGGAVTIRNCVLGAGIEIRNPRVTGHLDLIRANQNHGFVLSNQAFAAYRGGDVRWRRLWGGSPKVTLEAVSIWPERGQNDTMLIGPYVHGVRASGLSVHSGEVTAIYLAGGSWGNDIEDSRIWGDVHIDGSFRNTLRRNSIDGWVRTYKNCGETHGNRAGLPVVTPANGNRLIDNDISGTIHLAARQDRDLSHQECSDDSPYPSDECTWIMDGWWPTCKPLNRVYWLDYSARNEVRGGHVPHIIVEDDWNRIDVPQSRVEIGAKMRAKYLGRPVRVHKRPDRLQP